MHLFPNLLLPSLSLSPSLFSHSSNLSASSTLITHPKCCSPLPSSLVPLCPLWLPNTFLPSNPASHHSYSSIALLVPSIPLSVCGSSLRTFPDVTVQHCPRGQQHNTRSVAHTHIRSALTLSAWEAELSESRCSKAKSCLMRQEAGVRSGVYLCVLWWVVSDIFPKCALFCSVKFI